MKKLLLIIFLPILLTFTPKPETKGKGLILLTFNGFHAGQVTWERETFANAGLTQFELIQVQARVAYLFKDWDVIVTTDDSLFYHHPINKRIRVIVTSDTIYHTYIYYTFSSFMVERRVVGGISYPSTMSREDTTPSVVSTQLRDVSLRAIGDCIAHEVGHTLGLDHEGTDYSDYDMGTPFRAPIMGASYWSQEAYWTEENDSIISLTFRKLEPHELKLIKY